MTRLRKRSRKEREERHLAKTIDDQLKGFGHYREHLASDNTYAESINTSPETSSSEDLTSVAAAESDSVLLDTKAKAVRKEKEQAVAKRLKYRFKPLSTRHESSILDQKSSRKSPFFGFYTLFWVTVAFVVVRRLIYNYLKHQQFGMNIASLLFRDLVKIALTDLLMYVLTYFGVFLQLAVKHGLIDWDRTGWVIQNVWQASFLFFFMWFADYMRFPWIGCVFLLLHSLVLLMKQHSYAFYNGYFWKISRDLDNAKKLVAKLSCSEDGKDEEALSRLNEQIDFCIEELNDGQITTARFPNNITFSNYFVYSMFPTLVYQIDYPRNDRIRWSYVAEKVIAIFGVFFLMIMVAETFLFPIAMKAIELRNRSPYERLKAYPFILLDLVPPFILMYLLVFYIIWDAILNAIAELTRFGDREFYGEWWNCVSWDQFAKDWNMPVYRFLLRHVYHSSMSALRVSKMTATVLTFLLSSCVHELVMLVIFKRLRGYLLILQMCQLPLVVLSRTRFLRNKEILGNIVFWVGIITGPSLMCSLYLTF
ncbi:sterol O-acyltransferase 2 [Trichomonascus vanleenenianus]|uniref:sterol O-acyltransferase 2 n=1 Tax=Trichomonascus vanleenenianus TaxID=2268995 RepID=UPI003ECB345B